MMNHQFVGFVVILCSLLLLPSCSEQRPPLNELSREAVVVAFGDSLTYGTGAKDHESYPHQLAKLIDREVINEGVPGELSGEGRQRLPNVLDEHQPELLILCHGGNDLLRKKNPESIVNNLKSMIGEAKRRGIQVLLIAVPEPALFFMEPASFYIAVAQSENIPLLQNTLRDIENDDGLKSDAIHPNAAGYRKLAEAVARLLQSAGAL
ncbi:MAG: arylesterase [Gammaproteobacteria bacterium]|jgi:lysophospholipase L1-like esterase